MDADEIQTCIHDGIAKALADQLPIAVNNAVNASVNGKIKALDEKVTPMVNAYNSWLTTRRAVIIVLGFFLAVGGLIQSAQTFYGLITNYFTISLR
jgi:hypothetical protein